MFLGLTRTHVKTFTLGYVFYYNKEKHIKTRPGQPSFLISCSLCRKLSAEMRGQIFCTFKTRSNSGVHGCLGLGKTNRYRILVQALNPRSVCDVCVRVFQPHWPAPRATPRQDVLIPPLTPPPPGRKQTYPSLIWSRETLRSWPLDCWLAGQISCVSVGLVGCTLDTYQTECWPAGVGIGLAGVRGCQLVSWYITHLHGSGLLTVLLANLLTAVYQ
jgi:hypothetical protein